MAGEMTISGGRCKVKEVTLDFDGCRHPKIRVWVDGLQHRGGEGSAFLYFKMPDEMRDRLRKFFEDAMMGDMADWDDGENLRRLLAE